MFKYILILSKSWRMYAYFILKIMYKYSLKSIYKYFIFKSMYTYYIPKYVCIPII